MIKDIEYGLWSNTVSKIKIPDDNILEYIKSNFEYEDGRINGPQNKDIGTIFQTKRGPICRLSVAGTTRKLRRYHIVWYLCRGWWPMLEIDHRDRNTLNDKIENLREVTVLQQQENKNNSRMYNGFSIQLCVDKKRSKPWRVRNQKLGYNIGYYKTKEAAEQAIDRWLETRGKWWV